jgi:imidazolonepropionase-like amidohydrolase
MSPRRHSRIVAIAAGAAVVAAVGCRYAAKPAPSSSTSSRGAFTIHDVRLFDGERVSEHRTVLVDGGRIARVGGLDLAPAGRVIDGRGRTLLPGLLDAHVHVANDVDTILRQAASLGVTTVIDMWNGGERFVAMKRAREADAPHLASLLTAGTGATAPGGHPSQMGGGSLPTIGDAGEAQAFVDARIADGSDFLKIIYDDLQSLGLPAAPMLDRETLAALVQAAHRRGKLAVVHISTEAQAREAIAAGADGLVHLFAGETAGEGFGEVAARHGAFVVPTLSVLETFCGRPNGAALLADPDLKPFLGQMWREQLGRSFGRPAQPCAAIGEGVRQLVAAGATIVAGSDAPNPGTAYGASLHGELALLVSHSLTPVQALVAATSAAARAFRLADRGLVREGMRADLVLVEGDPTTDILATRRIVEVWKAGVPVERQRFPVE